VRPTPISARLLPHAHTTARAGVSGTAWPNRGSPLGTKASPGALPPWRLWAGDGARVARIRGKPIPRIIAGPCSPRNYQSAACRAIAGSFTCTDMMATDATKAPPARNARPQSRPRTRFAGFRPRLGRPQPRSPWRLDHGVDLDGKI